MRGHERGFRVVSIRFCKGRGKAFMVHDMVLKRVLYRFYRGFVGLPIRTSSPVKSSR